MKLVVSVIVHSDKRTTMPEWLPVSSGIKLNYADRSFLTP